MGNANGKEDDAVSNVDADATSSNAGDPYSRIRHGRPSSESMSSSPPVSPARSPSPFLFPPQVPVAPLQRTNAPPSPNKIQWNQSQRVSDHPTEQGLPIIITWNQGGNDVAVEGSWDNWRSRKKLEKSGKDHSILFVLPSGIYHYKVIVDGECKYLPDLPFVSDEMGNVCNILDVHNYVPENPESIAEFEAPPSPDHSYGQALPTAEDYTKDPLAVPPQLRLTLVDTSGETGKATKPQHVVLNHVFIEQGWSPQSIVALGLTHRFESKYITVVLYKPLPR
ncbi:SNF1-related protein kinase regulatory subunit beta-1 [Hirschfeldia incana]|nr:SNF1-related protein kinase regulatory subunit beta-1 [Hirschfeldia incana]